MAEQKRNRHRRPAGEAAARDLATKEASSSKIQLLRLGRSSADPLRNTPWKRSLARVCLSSPLSRYAPARVTCGFRKLLRANQPGPASLGFQPRPRVSSSRPPRADTSREKYLDTFCACSRGESTKNSRETREEIGVPRVTPRMEETISDGSGRRAIDVPRDPVAMLRRR